MGAVARRSEEVRRRPIDTNAGSAGAFVDDPDVVAKLVTGDEVVLA